MKCVVTPVLLGEGGASPARASTEYVYGESVARAGRTARTSDDQDIDPNDAVEPFVAIAGHTVVHDQVPARGTCACRRLPLLLGQPRSRSISRSSGQYRDDRFLESQTLLARATSDAIGRVGAYAATEFADDLQSPDNPDRDDFLLQRLPRAATLSGVPAKLAWHAGRGRPSLDVEYTYFYAKKRPNESATRRAMSTELPRHRHRRDPGRPSATATAASSSPTARILEDGTRTTVSDS